MPSIIRCCKDCPDRKIVDGVRCHDWCERYAKESATNKQCLDDKFKDTYAVDYVKDQRTKALRRKHNKRHK